MPLHPPSCKDLKKQFIRLFFFDAIGISTHRWIIHLWGAKFWRKTTAPMFHMVRSEIWGAKPLYQTHPGDKVNRDLPSPHWRTPDSTGEMWSQPLIKALVFHVSKSASQKKFWGFLFHSVEMAEFRIHKTENHKNIQKQYEPLWILKPHQLKKNIDPK